MIAIKVMLESNLNTLFIIEGFEKKEITDNVLLKYIKEHFQWLNPNNKVIVNLIDNDFVVQINDSEYLLTWPWIKSYKIQYS